LFRRRQAIRVVNKLFTAGAISSLSIDRSQIVPLYFGYSTFALTARSGKSASAQEPKMASRKKVLLKVSQIQDRHTKAEN